MKKKRSLLPLLAALLLLGGVAAGGWYVWTHHKADVESFLSGLSSDSADEEGDEEAATSKKGKGRKKRPKKNGTSPKDKDQQAKGVDRKAPTDPDGREKPAPDRDSLESVLSQARANFDALQYEQARYLLADILGAPAPKDLKEKAEELDSLSRTFGEIVEGIRPQALSDSRDIVIVHLTNGGKRRGRVLRRTAEKVYLVENNGIKAIFKNDEIDRLEPLTPEQDRKAKEAQFETFRTAQKGKAESSALLFFILARYCVEHGLTHRVNQLLTQGLETDKDFPWVVYNEKAKKYYHRYMFFRGRKFPKSAAKALKVLLDRFPKSFFADEARKDEAKAGRPVPKPEPKPEPRPGPRPKVRPEPKPEPAEEPDPWEEEEPEPEPAPGPAPKGKLLNQANQLMARARVHDQKSFPGRPNADAELVKAIAAYSKAMEVLEEALKEHPENERWIESKLEQVQSALYWCRKRQKIG